MAIEIIPKKKEESVSPIGAIAWYIGLGLFLVSILISLAFLFLSWRASQETKEIRAEIEAKKNQEIIDLEDKMKGNHQIVLDFAYILNKRVSPTPILEAIEKNIHPKVSLSDLQIDTATKTINLNGIAADITAFDQQKRLFERDKTIASFNISTFTRKDDGRISFPMTITFSDQLLNLESGQ